MYMAYHRSIILEGIQCSSIKSYNIRFISALAYLSLIDSTLYDKFLAWSLPLIDSLICSDVSYTLRVHLVNLKYIIIFSTLME